IYIAVTFMVHPLLGFITLGGSVILFVLAWITNIATQKPLAEANQASIAAGAFANNHLRNAEVIEAMGMLPGLRSRWFQQHQRVLGLQTLASDRNARISTISRFVRISLQSLILGAGALLVIEGEITAGMMIVCSILMGKARGATVVLITHRMSVLSVVDKLLVLRDGVLTMYGPRDDVLKALRQQQLQATQAKAVGNSATSAPAQIASGS